MAISEVAAAPVADEARGPVRYLMHDEATLAQIARDAVAHAGRVSAGRAVAIAGETGGFSIKTAGGEVVSAERDGAQTLTVTIVDHGRTGRASTGIFSDAAIRSVVEQAAFIASQVEPDPDAELADPEALARDAADVPLYAPSGRSAAALAYMAGAIEAAAQSAIQDAGQAASDTARVLETNASSSDRRWALAIGQDFNRAASASMQSCWTQVIAERQGKMASDHWSSQDRRIERLLSPEAIGATAVERAVRKLGGRSLSTRDCPILFDATLSAGLIGEVVRGLSGMAQYQKATFLADALGRPVLAPHLDLIEDPTEAYGFSSGTCDGEGIAGSRRAVVRAGVAEGYFLATKSARKLGMPSTGNADGPWNLSLTSSLTEAGDDLVAMLRRLDRGLWLTETMGGGVNPVTGSYSKAAGGFWVENGQIVHPVEDITIAGDLPAMLAGIVHLGADVHRGGATRSGSILIDTMRIAGR